MLLTSHSLSSSLITWVGWLWFGVACTLSTATVIIAPMSSRRALHVVFKMFFLSCDREKDVIGVDGFDHSGSSS